MLHFHRLLLPFLGFLLALALPVQGADLDKFLPNDTDALLIANVQQMAESPLFKMYYQEPLQKLLMDNEKIKKAVTALAFDPLKDIDRLVVANSESLYRLEKTVVKNQVVINSVGGLFVLVQGRFDVAKFHTQAETLAKELGIPLKMHKVGEAKLYEIDLGQALFVAPIDGATLMVSTVKDAASEVLEKVAGKKKTVLRSREVAKIIAKPDPKQSFTILATGGMVYDLDVQAVKVGGKVVEKTVKTTLATDGIDAVSGNITITDGISGDIVVTFRTAAAAKDFANSVKQLLSKATEKIWTAARNDKLIVPFEEFFKSLKTAAENRTVTIRAQVSAKEIAEALK